jgi:glucokinase
MNGEITILKKQSIETDHNISAYEMLSRIFDMADGILDKAPDAVGISCGGPLDSIRGVIMSPPNLPGWDNIEIVRLTGERFNSPVHLQNDANACAVAEWKFGAGRGFSNIAFLTFGTGLGAGLILNGRLYDGTNGNAGELGHIRLEKDGPIGFGKAGSFEGFCSGGGIAKLGCTFANEAIKNGVTPLYASLGIDGITAKSIAQAAIAGDETAIKVYNTSGRYLGRGLSILIDILNPERIIIGGVFMRSHKLLWESAEEELKKETLSCSLDVCKVVPSELGENIGDYAALATALL